MDNAKRNGSMHPRGKLLSEKNAMMVIVTGSTYIRLVCVHKVCSRNPAPAFFP